MNKIIFSIAVILALVVQVHAKVAEKGLYFTQKIGVRYNPVGLLLDSRLYYRFPLVKKEGILWESTKIDAGIQNEWTPTDDLIAFRVTVEPVAFFDITFRGGFAVIYNLLGYGYYPLEGPDAPYDDNALEKISPENRSGFWFTVAPTVKIKVSSVIIANACNIHLFTMGDKGYFLEMRTYAIRKTQDTDLRNDLYLFYKFNDKWMTGADYYFLYVRSTEYTIHRICGVIVFTPQIRSLYSASAALTAGAYLKDRYYKGKPYIGLRLGIELKAR